MLEVKDRYRFLYKLAHAYYEDGLTQQQIANRFHLSRPKVSRLLQEARDEKVVTITLTPPSGGTADLETELEKKYGLDEVVVVSISNPRNNKAVARELGPTAAELLLRTLQGDEIIGLAWGATILTMVDAMPVGSRKNFTLVQMIGGLQPDHANEHSAEIVRRAARKLHAEYQLIQAPGIASNVQAAKALRSDSRISETLALAAKANVAVVGLGMLSDDSLLLQSGELLSQSDLNVLKSAGAVGDVILRFFDANGVPLDLEINKRIIGLSLEQLRKIPRVIGLAGGERKYDIIRAVLRSRVLNVLITDHITAKKLRDEEN